MNNIFTPIASLRDDKDTTITPKEEEEIVSHFIKEIIKSPINSNEIFTFFIKNIISSKNEFFFFTLCKILNTIHTELPTPLSISWSQRIDEEFINNIIDKPLLHSSKDYKIIKLLPSLLKGKPIMLEFNTLQRIRNSFLKKIEEHRKLQRKERSLLWKSSKPPPPSLNTKDEEIQTRSNVLYFNQINSITAQWIFFDINLLPRPPSYLLEEIIKKVLFGDDFGILNDQPHYKYYWKEDDMISLSFHNFNTDPFHHHKNKNNIKMYKERSYRFRKINEIYSDGDNFIKMVGKHYGDGIRRFREENFDKFSFIKNLENVLVMSMENSQTLLEVIAILMILGLNRYIDCCCLFSSSKFGIDWTLKYSSAMFGCEKMDIFISKTYNDKRFITLDKVLDCLHFL